MAVDAEVRPAAGTGSVRKPTLLPARGRSWFERYELLLQLSDLAAIAVAMIAVLLLRFGEDLQVKVGGLPISYPLASFLVGIAWWYGLDARRSRDRAVVGHGLEEFRRVMSASLYMFGAVAIASYLLQAELSRAYFIVLLPLGTLLLLVGRWVCRQYLHRRRAVGGAYTSTVVVGSAREIVDVVRDLRRNRNAGYRPVGIAVPIVDTDSELLDHPELEGLPRLEIATLDRDIAAYRIGAVVVVPGMPRAKIRRLAWRLENSPVELLFVPSLTDVAGPRLAVNQVQDLSLLRVDLPRFSGWNHALKRAFDIAFSLVALFLIAPIILVVAVLIKREDGGPVFFRQERIGMGGKPFIIHKFRTMATDAEERIDALIAASGGKALLFKMEDDPRITKIGKVLRKYSIDELPQFWTVLRGDMSVVGPRPQVAREVAEYTGDLHRRLLIKPGITGLWQVSGRSDLSIEDSIRLDLRYVENWSLTGDAAIMMKTVRTVLKPEGAI